MLSVVMLTGLFQQKNSNFEGVIRKEFAAVGCECFTDHALAHPLNSRGEAVARLSV